MNLFLETYTVIEKNVRTPNYCTSHTRGDNSNHIISTVTRSCGIYHNPRRWKLSNTILVHATSIYTAQQIINSLTTTLSTGQCPTELWCMLHTSRNDACQTQIRCIRVLQAWTVVNITEWFGQGKAQIQNFAELILWVHWIFVFCTLFFFAIRIYRTSKRPLNHSASPSITWRRKASSRCGDFSTWRPEEFARRTVI
jgi:hypothetical protein